MAVVNFAYGSNLHPMRLSKRVKSASLIGTGYTSRRRLEFHKKSADGSGKCDIPEDTASSIVYGALFSITDSDWPTLQRFEGVGAGYAESWVSVSTTAGVVLACVFLAQPEYIEPSLSPYEWYKTLVLEGARFHAFPDEYLNAIKTVISIPDPNTNRSLKNWNLINRIRSNA